VKKIIKKTCVIQGKVVPLHPQKCVLRWLYGYQYPGKKQLSLQLRSSYSFFLSGILGLGVTGETLKKKQYIHIFI